MTQFSRRRFLQTGAAFAAIGAAGSMSLISSRVYAALRDKGYYSYKIGSDIEVISIYDGIFKLPLNEGFVQGAKVDEVRQVLTGAGFSGEFMPLEFAFTVIRTPTHTVLIDAGTGGQMVPTAGLASTGFNNAGISPADIDTVILSHMHADHSFGLLEKDTNKQIYPNAEILINETEYQFWTDETNNSKLNERFRNQALRHQATFSTFKNISLYSDNQADLVPGINAVAAPGHTLGHTAFHIASGNDQLLLIGDAVLTPSVFAANPDWQVAVDMDKAAAKETRYRLLERAINDNVTIAGYHFGFPNSGRLEKDGNGFTFVPVNS